MYSLCDGFDLNELLIPFDSFFFYIICASELKSCESSHQNKAYVPKDACKEVTI